MPRITQLIGGRARVAIEKDEGGVRVEELLQKVLTGIICGWMCEEGGT